MLVGEHQSEVLWVNAGIVATPLFWVNVPTACERIRLGTEFSGPKMDYHIEIAIGTPSTELVAG